MKILELVGLLTRVVGSGLIGLVDHEFFSSEIGKGLLKCWHYFSENMLFNS